MGVEGNGRTMENSQMVHQNAQSEVSTTGGAIRNSHSTQHMLAPAAQHPLQIKAYLHRLAYKQEAHSPSIIH